MKIAITGHTKGIGKSFCDLATKKGFTVVGLSRSNGNDITTSDLLGTISDCDVFINNAYAPVYQTKLLEQVLEHWEGKDKLIINISSKLSFTTPTTSKKVEQYIKDKTMQNDIMKRHMLRAYPKVCNVILGLADTEMSSVFKSDKKMNTDDIADLVLTLVENKKLCIQEIVLESPELDWKTIEIGD